MSIRPYDNGVVTFLYYFPILSEIFSNSPHIQSTITLFLHTCPHYSYKLIVILVSFIFSRTFYSIWLTSCCYQCEVFHHYQSSISTQLFLNLFTHTFSPASDNAWIFRLCHHCHMKKCTMSLNFGALHMKTMNLRLNMQS